jgi:cell division protein FtsL
MNARKPLKTEVKIRKKKKINEKLLYLMFIVSCFLSASGIYVIENVCHKWESLPILE